MQSLKHIQSQGRGLRKPFLTPKIATSDSLFSKNSKKLQHYYNKWCGIDLFTARYWGTEFESFFTYVRKDFKYVIENNKNPH